MEITETYYAPTRGAWRAWLKKHHKTKSEIWLIYYKKASGKRGLDYGPAVEEALCYGWIDTTVKPIDADRYAQRYTPRKKGSNWSTPNLIRVKQLLAAGLMTPAGAVHLPSAKEAKEAKAFHAKHAARTNGTDVAPKDFAAALKKSPKALAFWKTLAPGYRRTFIRWMGDVKSPEARARRIAKVVSLFERGLKTFLNP